MGLDELLTSKDQLREYHSAIKLCLTVKIKCRLKRRNRKASNIHKPILWIITGSPNSFGPKLNIIALVKLTKPGI